MEKKTYISILVGDLKDNYIAIGSNEIEAKERIIKKYFDGEQHGEEDLNEQGIYIDIFCFDEDNVAIVY